MQLTDQLFQLLFILRFLFSLLGVIIALLLFIFLCWYAAWQLVLKRVPFIQDIVGRPSDLKNSNDPNKVNITGDAHSSKLEDKKD